MTRTIHGKLEAVRGKSPFVALAEYLRGIEAVVSEEDQIAWFARLKKGAAVGTGLFEGAGEALRGGISTHFERMARTEELKAWYGSPERGELFQGTSIASLTVPAVMSRPLILESVSDLEESLADEYIAAHERHREAVGAAIAENVEKWLDEGLYYGVVIASKVISQAFGLHVHRGEVLRRVAGLDVDPHELVSCPPDVRRAYFEACRGDIACFAGLDLSRVEFEQSLVTADISKPNISAYRDRLLLGPVRCNEICTLLSRRVSRLIRDKTGGGISPRPLMVTVYDTDTPYAYHRISGYPPGGLSPVLPGLIIQGSSGTADAFRWLYAYRTSLVAQKIMKGSLNSETRREYVPFVFFGVLVPRDADILLDMNRLGALRYRGNLSPLVEFSYLVSKIAEALRVPGGAAGAAEISERIR